MKIIPNGLFTITNPEGDHRTFKINTIQNGDLKGKRRISLLTGPDNENHYRGFGFVDDETIVVWRKKRDKTHIWYAKLVEAAHKQLQTRYDSEEEVLDMDFEFKGRTYILQHSKRCLKCNRTLTDPESLKRGIGPRCAGLV